MTLARRLAKLEKAAGKGERCAWCRLTLHTSPPDPMRRRVPSRLARCEFCGTEYNRADRSSGPGDLTDRVGGHYATFAPDDFYTDARALASRLWFYNWPWRVLSDGARGVKGERYRQLQKLIEGSRARAAEVRGVRADGSKVDRETVKARERRAAVAAEKAALERRARRARLETYGRRFPALDRLKPRLAAQVETWEPADARFRPRVEVSRLVAFAKLEKIIFGGVQAETLEALAHWRAAWAAKKGTVLEKRRGELRLAGLNAGRKAAGLREFYSLDDAERTLKREREEAERQEAERPAPPPTPVPASDVTPGDYDEAAPPWWLPRSRGGAEIIGAPDEVGAAPPGVSLPESDQAAGIRRVLREAGAWPAVNGHDPTAGLRLTPNGEIVGPDGKPPATPDPRSRYYDTDRPAPTRPYSAGVPAPARRYRPRTT